MRPEVYVVNGAEHASPPTLWFEQPAEVWEEALPIGNGRMGGMVYGGIESERVQLNEDTFWTGSPYTPANKDTYSKLPKLRQLIFDGKEHEAEAMAEKWAMGTPVKQCSYQPIGELHLDFPSIDASVVTDYKRSLDLSTAIASTIFRHKGVLHRREVFASPLHQVIAYALSADMSGQIDVDISFDTVQPSAQVRVDGDLKTVILFGKNQGAHGVPSGLDFEARAHIVATNGDIKAADGRLKVRGADRIVIRVAIATSFVKYNDTSADPAARNIETIQALRQASYGDLRQQSINNHRDVFSRMTVDLGETDQSRKPTDRRLREHAKGLADPGLATLYVNFGRYLLITSSRPGSQPSNLQGIWSDSLTPTWDSKFTININTEMNYWPAEPANMREAVEPLIAMVRDLAETGRETARVMYDARGWVCHHNTDLWRATAPIDFPQSGLWPMGGAWLCRHLWDRYDYSRDLEFLDSVYQIFVGACEFFLDVLVADPRSGYLVTAPSLSPENRHHEDATLCAGPSMDNQILRDLFNITIDSAKLLNRDADLQCQLSKTLSRLRPDTVSKGGRVKEWQDDWDEQAPDQEHRHVSQLYAVYPSNQITVDSTPELADAARETLIARGHGGTGWSTAWKIGLWARLRDSKNAYANIRELLSPELCYSNMFDVHPPLSGYARAVFQIDGNLGGCAGILEMLFQDSGREGIRLLPALPAEWPTGHVSGFRLRGGLEGRLEWREGKLERLVLRGSTPIETKVTLEESAVSLRLGKGESKTITLHDFI